MRAVEMKRAAIDQGVASFCHALRLIGDFWKTNHDWMDKIRHDDQTEIIAEAVLATLHGLISIVKSNDDGDGNRRRAFEKLRMDSRSGSTCCFVIPVDGTSVAPKLKVFPRLAQVLKRNRGSDGISRANQKVDNQREGDPPNRGSLSTGNPPIKALSPSIPDVPSDTERESSRNPPPASIEKGSPPQPPPPTQSAKGRAAPPPPPPTPSRKGLAPPPPPPKPLGKGSGPPPPPPMGANKHRLPSGARPKLKRLTHIAALYRSVKERMEGSATAVRSTSKVPKAQLGGGQQGMADTIAEMKKKSAYHQQIESDVETYQKVIVALKDSINTFKTADMVELLKFHRFAESCLVKLTDESQVLARFEGFPISKLEAIRSAAALYSKLNSFHLELKNWKISSPSDALLDRIGQYFDKMKREIDAIERRKDEESKLFERNQIKFDFGILTRIKEAAVDVCSGCMELSLKEGNESEVVKDKQGRRKSVKQRNQKNELLWRAVQFAFRVYSFAGGFDDHADKLVKELAREIEMSFQAKP
ncbi:hypothetical protein MLD38_036982 [Melastoma candidum]|uniref:Uncharacterized protein n=1 Tax=Melastoma candidum TaxID=119954 RepID=A0ACB9LL87_9MYRT|nr:hypothetical protein MLD38_036982 [Melastoma candidum]